MAGLTLIELLVVVAIIAIISTLTISSYREAHGQARDTARRSDINTLRRALLFYLDESNGYPLSTGECLVGSGGVGQILEQDENIIIRIPQDPLWPADQPSTFNGGVTKDYAISPSNNFCFWYYSGSPNKFYLSYFLENDSTAGTQGIHVMTQDGLIGSLYSRE